ncbi:hypothetical protein WCD74_21720 [Actinomycetospora sp. OC33-EN08]|uniref:DUF3515 domain-containing protein n=1 Tax=Actinomycetospora aurantiaca TaxID=3129233 RepID=A0ABU8MTV8_9PSEU
MSTRAFVAAGGVAALVLVGVLALVAGWAGGGRADFASLGVDAVPPALAADGLVVCSRVDRPGPAAVLEVAADPAGCAAGAVARVGVERFATTAARDAAARAEEVRVRPRGSAVVHTWGDLLVTVPGTADDAVTDRVGDALRAAGAQ